MKYINPQGAPRSWCNAVKSAYDIENNIDTITVSGLHLPPKIRLLTIRHSNEIEVDVVDQAHTLFGEAFHYVVTKAQDDTYIAEKRVMTVIQDKIFTGKPDLYDTINYIVEDYKTASVWTYMFNVEEWETKMNCYAWLERTVNHRKVKGLLAVIYFKDWRRSELLRYPNYPKRNLLWITPPLWDIAKQEKFINTRIQFHKAPEAAHDDYIPACSRKERWADDDIYAIHKGAHRKINKRATNAQCTTREQAVQVVAKLRQKHPEYQYVINYRPGLDKRCASDNPRYCKVREFCNYYNERYSNEKNS